MLALGEVWFQGIRLKRGLEVFALPEMCFEGMGFQVLALGEICFQGMRQKGV